MSTELTVGQNCGWKLYVRACYLHATVAVLCGWANKLGQAVNLAQSSVPLELQGSAVTAQALKTKISKAINEYRQKVGWQDVYQDGMYSTGTFLTGTPGIGKTAFGWYLALVCKHFGLPFLLRPKLLEGTNTHNSPGVYCDEEGNIRCAAYANIGNDWYKVLIIQDHSVIDSTAPGYVVVTSSPNKENIKYADRKNDDGRYACRCLPVWTSEEICDCRERCYSDLAQHLVETLFQRFGGIARIIFWFPYKYIFKSKSTNEVLQSIDDEVCQKINEVNDAKLLTDYVLHGVARKDQTAAVSDTIFHMVPLDIVDNRNLFFLHEATRELATSYIRNLVFARLVDLAQVNVESLRRVTSRVPTTKGTAGPMLERLVFELLVGEYGTFSAKARKLNTKKETTECEEWIHFSPTPLTVFRERNELPKNLLLSENLQVPQQSNFESIDACRRCKVNGDDFFDLFQITGSTKHPVNYKGLASICDDIANVNQVLQAQEPGNCAAADKESEPVNSAGAEATGKNESRNPATATATGKCELGNLATATVTKTRDDDIPVRFFFCVPERYLEKFTYQQFKGKANHSEGKRWESVGWCNVQQYVLGIPNVTEWRLRQETLEGPKTKGNKATKAIAKQNQAGNKRSRSRTQLNQGAKSARKTHEQ